VIVAGHGRIVIWIGDHPLGARAGLPVPPVDVEVGRDVVGGAGRLTSFESGDDGVQTLVAPAADRVRVEGGIRRKDLRGKLAIGRVGSVPVQPQNLVSLDDVWVSICALFCSVCRSGTGRPRSLSI
jgi:hypothetical protein